MEYLKREKIAKQRSSITKESFREREIERENNEMCSWCDCVVNEKR